MYMMGIVITSDIECMETRLKTFISCHHYNHDRRTHFLRRRQSSYNYQQLHRHLSSVPRKPVRLETILNSISYPSPLRSITYPSQNRTITYPSSNKTITYPSSNKSITYPSSNKTITYPSSHKTITYPSSNKTITYPSSDKTITYPSSNRTITYLPLNRTINYPSPNNSITYKVLKAGIIGPRINISVFIKQVFVVFCLIIVTVASGSDMIFKNTLAKFAKPSATTKSASQSPSSPYSTLYHPSSVTTSTDISSPTSSLLPSKISIPDSLSLHSQHSSARMDQPDTRAQILSQLISSLEKLHVLNKTQEACFRLDKITITKTEYSSSAFSTTLQSPTADPTTIGVLLYFRELPVPTSGLSSSTEKSKSSTHHSVSSNQHSSSSTQHLIRSNQQPGSSLKADSRSPNNKNKITDYRCASQPVIEVHRMAGNSDMHKGVNQSMSHRHTDSHTQRTLQFNSVPTAGLSRTQIVVISTCSGIIGMFFLIAAFLRLRNYIKRSRMEQELARRPKFRSCSVALRGATQSMEQLRRDSVSSKASHQNSLLTQGGNNVSGSQRDMSANSLRYQLDQEPLLINSKCLKALDASTLADSHLSLKYIDEISMTPKKKDIALSLMAKNNNNNIKKYVPIESCLVHQAEISMDASTLTTTQAGPMINNANIPRAWKKSARFSGSKRGGHLNPVSCTGSFKGRVLEGAVTADVDQLNMQPRLRWVRVAGDDRSPETMLRMFTKSGSTGQIVAHNNSSANSRLDVKSTGQIGAHNTSSANSRLDVESTEQIVVHDTSNANSRLDVESTGQIGAHNTSSANSRLETGSGLNVEGSQVGLILSPSSGTQSEHPIDGELAGQPRAVFGFKSGESVGGDVHNLETQLEVTEHDRQDEEHDRQDEEHDRQNKEHDRQDEEHDRQDKEHDRQNKEHDRQDREHDRQDREHDRQDKENDRQDKEYDRQDKEYDRQDKEYDRKDQEHDRQDKRT